MNIQSFLAIDSLITGLFALFFGLVILIKDRRNIINQTGFLLTIATAIWAFGYWRWLSALDSEEVALFWVRIFSIGSIFIPVFYFHWISSLLDLNKKNKLIIRGVYFLAVVFLSFSFSSYFVKGVGPAMDYFLFWPVPGFLYTSYLFVIYFGLVVYSIYLLLISYKIASGTRKTQLWIVLCGSILGFGGGATNFFLWYGISVLPLGNVFVILYPVLFSYSIIKHRFMDIKFILRRYSVFLISLFSVVVPTLALQYLFHEIFAFDLYLEDMVVVMIAVFAFPSIKNHFYRLANKYFFSSLYDPKEVIAELSDKIQSTLEVEKIYSFINETFSKSFHIRSVGVFVYNEKKKEFFVQYNNNSRSKSFLQFPGVSRYEYHGMKVNKELHKKYLKQGHPLIVEELKTREYDGFKKNIDFFNDIGIEMLIPLNVKNKTLGMIVLGDKESGDMYNEEDIYVLKIIGVQVAIAIENALLFKETKDFNVKLEKEVWKATKEVVEANEKLKKLDVAKSDFISIASHQLRTPLTVIKGYISMVLDGNFGKLLAPQKDSLKKVFQANERLIDLVEDLLSISRIESGRIQYDFKKINIEEVIDSVCEELKIVADKKGLDFELVRPKKCYPKMLLDAEKIRQVIMNLTDNAIKYTEKGKITVKLSRVKGHIRYCVKDTGMGIKPDDMPHLFKKFSRGTGSFMIHTEGTGLGLYVAKQMVEAHGGRTWAESKGEGSGSEFCFEIDIDKNKKIK